MADVETIKSMCGTDSEIYVIRTPGTASIAMSGGRYHEVSAKAAWPRFIGLLKKHLKK